MSWEREQSRARVAELAAAHIAWLRALDAERRADPVAAALHVEANRRLGQRHGQPDYQAGFFNLSGGTSAIAAQEPP